MVNIVLVADAFAKGELMSETRYSSYLTALFLVMAWTFFPSTLLAQPQASGIRPSEFEERLRTGDPKALEAVIRFSYHQLSAYALNSGSDLRFDLSGFRTFNTLELADKPFTNLVSLPEGWTIQAVRHRVKNAALGLDRLEYSVAWEHRPATPALTLYGQKTFNQVLDDIALDRPETRSRVRAVTSYKVTAHLQGRSRSYSAAFLWVSDARTGRWNTIGLLALDAISPHIEAALLEETPPQGTPIRITSSPAASKALCVPSTSTVYESDGLSDNKRHTTGSHDALIGIEFTCSCSSNCTLQCTPRVDEQFCGEAGSTTGFHVTSADVENVHGSATNALSTGAQCASGYICAVKQCSFPGCAFTVGVSFSGLSISFQDTGAFWSFKARFDHQCGPCQEYTGGGGGMIDDFKPSPDPGGGSGGWPGIGSSSTCTTIWTSDGGYWSTC